MTLKPRQLVRRRWARGASKGYPVAVEESKFRLPLSRRKYSFGHYSFCVRVVRLASISSCIQITHSRARRKATP